MNESAQHHVPYEEILHAIAMDAHACGKETWDVPPRSPDHIDQPITSCSHPPLACATQEHSNRKPRSSRMNEKSQINATILRQLFETKAIRLELRSSRMPERNSGANRPPQNGNLPRQRKIQTAYVCTIHCAP